MLNMDAARRHLRDLDLTRLFVEGLGWEKPGPDIAVVLNDAPLPLTAVAHKRGLGVYLCPPLADGAPQSGGLPDHATRRRIDALVRKQVHERLLIFTDGARSLLKWLYVRREPGRPALSREFDYAVGQSGEALLQRLQGIATDLDEEEGLTIVDMTSRVRAAFDVDRVTKRFYDRFKVEHDGFLGFLQGIPDDDLARWYVSITLNRLMFVYFIQEKQFLGGDPGYLRARLTESRMRGPDRFYREFLCPLFFEGFALPEGQRSPEARRLLGDVPFLNGGIFARHELEERYGQQIQIADAAFERLFAFFGEWHWCLDDRPLRNDREINPDVLGYIFEKYINQKQMGAYYTKEDITGYIAKYTLLPHLLDRARRDCKIAFEGEQCVWRLMQEDPDRYIYPAVRHGCEAPLPPEIAVGLRPPTLHHPVGEGPVATIALRRAWNRPAPPEYALPTEIWRETVARRQRYEELWLKLADGQVREPNDLITYNLDIVQFLQDVVEGCEGPELLRAIWKALRDATVLDPTCGSGAFLFAALNLLQPLYEACLERMQSLVDELDRSGEPHHPAKFQDFRDALAQADAHPNRRYYILKTIIVHNLYGVDIMDEAVEICHLRLFLKLAAQVERVEQIEPLPDIDFNIRAGNTLVGFTALDEVEKALTLSRQGQVNGREVTQSKMMGVLPEVAADLRRIREDAEIIAAAYRQFQAMQEAQGMAPGAFAAAKADLRARLDRLDGELDRALARTYGVDPDGPAYDPWRASHKPFHWLTAFFEIMQRGGFDVIVGNPPYVEYAKVNGEYTVRGYETESCGNLYAYVIERSLSLQRYGARLGLIVPVSLVCSERMLPLRTRTLGRSTLVWVSSFAIRPQPLFREIMQRNTVLITQAGRDARDTQSPQCFSSKYCRWTASERERLFQVLALGATSLSSSMGSSLPKIDSAVGQRVLGLVQSRQARLPARAPMSTVFFHDSGESYWTKALLEMPVAYRNNVLTEPAQWFTFAADASSLPMLYLMLNSSLAYWLWTALTDCRHVTKDFVSRLPVSAMSLDGRELMARHAQAYAANTVLFEKRPGYRSPETKVHNLKPIIDEIDTVLARHYGFTEEELDFIINYDIKYRMGDALNAGDSAAEDGRSEEE
jgi:hypothetical protein